MTYSLMDLVGDSKMATKKENKKKLHALLDKYGSVEEIERSGDLKDGYELDFARIDGALDEVLEERRMGYREPLSNDSDTLKSKVKQSNSLLPDDEDLSLEGLALSDRQRKAFNKLDMANQLVIIRALREQQGVEKPKPKKEEQEKSELDVLREKVEKANRELKIADNEQEGVKSDAEVEEEEESNNEKEDNDKKMQKALADLNIRRNGGVSFHDIYHAKYNNGKLVQNATERAEGGYVNSKHDKGGETNMGVTQNTLDAYKYAYKSSYKSNVSMPDNVKDLTKNQAMVILNEMFFRPYNINHIPDEKLARITFDSCVLAGPKMNKFFTEEILRVTEKKLYEVIYDKNRYNKAMKQINTVIPSDIAKITSTLSEKQKTEIADNLLKARIVHHFSLVIKDHSQINNLEGWYERARSLFSDGKVFDELFLEKRNDFLTKYEDYLDKIPYQRHQKRKKGLLK